VRNHGHRYYDWRYEAGSFRFFEHPLHFSREQVGKYVIQTEEPNLSAIVAVRLYKELSEVERALADLKDVLAAPAFLIHRAIEKGLRPLVSISPPPKR
jgi:hypothetical protein